MAFLFALPSISCLSRPLGFYSGVCGGGLYELPVAKE